MANLTIKQRKDIRNFMVFKRVQESLVRSARPYVEAILINNPFENVLRVINEVHEDLKRNSLEYQNSLEKLKYQYEFLNPVVQQNLLETCPYLFL